MYAQRWETDNLWSPDDELELEERARLKDEFDYNTPPALDADDD